MKYYIVLALLGVSQSIKLGYRPPVVEEAPDTENALQADESK